MPLEERQELIEEIERLRDGRTCVVLFNFDRESFPKTPGFSTQFASNLKEPIFRVLKEAPVDKGLDIFIYTRGGDLNAVWPMVSLTREFDEEFEVLVPYCCHSAGTMFTLGARKIILGPLSELSPIDPTCGNNFNPIDPVSKRDRMGISVEDVTAYRDFVLRQFGAGDKEPEQQHQLFAGFLQHLTSQVHPLALGNVHRVFRQGRQLARQLLNLNDTEGLEPDKIVDELSSKFFSHLHMINRHEAKRILVSRVASAPDELAVAMDNLLRSYETDFNLRRKFVVQNFLGEKEKEARVIGGTVESKNWSYLHETKLQIRRKSDVPGNIQLQLKAGDDINTIKGLPQSIEFELSAEGWTRNTTPLGITK